MRRMQIVVGIFALAFTFCAMKTEVCAENNDVNIIYTTEDSSTKGEFGENDGFLWEYDEKTKTLTVIGEDSGLNELKDAIPTNVTENVVNIIFEDCKASGSLEGLLFQLSTVESVEFKEFDTQNVTNMKAMFSNCSGLKKLDVSSFDTSNVTTMMGMFEGCSSLTELNISGWNTENVTSMFGMFCACSSLTNLDVSDLDTENVTNMNFMFCYCTNLKTLDLSNFNTENVTDMYVMFGECDNLLSLDLSSFNTTKVTDMCWMFYNCFQLSSLNISSFDTTNVEDLSDMLDSCSALRRIYTPKVMVEGQTIELPDTFYDSVSNSVATLSSETCNKVLQKEWTYYNITYHLNEGLNDIDNPVKYNAEFESIVLKNPTREGYDFDGWYTDSDFANKVTEIVKGSSGDKEFYAKWTEIMTPEKFVKAFVERMYTVALGRDADPQGVAYWTEQLLTHVADGAGLAQGFILGDEFAEKNYSDADYVKVLYKTFFNREADEGGIAFWISEMNNGKSRRSVLAGFVNSNEFDELCTNYGIERGTMVVEPTDPEPTPDPDPTPESGIQSFVERLYVIALERPSEPSGLADWTRRIESGENTPEDVAKFFFLSAEYVEKGTGNDKYIEALYLVFMDRASEPGGKAYWVSELEKGTGREAALEGFAQSQEFQEIMERYGL